MPIIDSGETAFSNSADKDKSVSSFTTVVGDTARSRSDDDSASSNVEMIDGSMVVNMYGDDVSTAVKFVNISADRTRSADAAMGPSKAFITSIGMAQKVDGASFDSWYSNRTIRSVDTFSMKS